jgi:hypothetical protein
MEAVRKAAASRRTPKKCALLPVEYRSKGTKGSQEDFDQVSELHKMKPF